MFGWIAKQRRKRRIVEYLKAFPDDEPAVQAIFTAIEMFGTDVVKSARQVAEMTCDVSPPLRFCRMGWQQQICRSKSVPLAQACKALIEDTAATP